MAQHRVTYTEIPGPTGEPAYIKTACHICGPSEPTRTRTTQTEPPTSTFTNHANPTPQGEK